MTVQNALLGYGGAGSTPVTSEVRYLLVGGGGSGGGTGGGGGGGGFLEGTTAIFTDTVYDIVVGAGGPSPGGDADGRNGGDSTFNGLRAFGGGGGGWSQAAKPFNITDGHSGGCGGGAPYNRAVGIGSQGGNGGGGSNLSYVGGGGGGAGGNGTAAIDSNNGGPGGPGRASDITGQTVYYAGGGGGKSNGNIRAPGGIGGGGSSSGYDDPSVSNAVDGTGGGGGSNNGNGSPAGRGGSGVVILRSSLEADVTGACEVTKVGNDNVYRFTGNGTIEFKVPKGMRYLLVGGGGAGGRRGGGGGAGGVVEGTFIPEIGVEYAVSVGTGGIGSTNLDVAQSGTDTSFNGIVAKGGGAGSVSKSKSTFAAGKYWPALSGGSGGGGSTYIGGAGEAANGIAGQGNRGGEGWSASRESVGCGGGGGAGEPGISVAGAEPYVRPDGGAGIQSDITGEAVWYGGGGGGRETRVIPFSGVGGLGGGGDGGRSPNFPDKFPGSNGVDGLGGGGGGSIGDSDPGGNGGSGVAIFRTFLDADVTGPCEVFKAGSDNVYRFTGSGTIKFK